MTDRTAQLDLCFDAVTRVTPAPRVGTLDERFEAWSRANPHVVDAFEMLALQAKRRGFRRIGAKMLFEILRWEVAMRTSDASGWRINNDYCSRVARLVADRNPELRGVFETRALKEKAA